MRIYHPLLSFILTENFEWLPDMRNKLTYTFLINNSLYPCRNWRLAYYERYCDTKREGVERNRQYMKLVKITFISLMNFEFDSKYQILQYCI